MNEDHFETRACKLFDVMAARPELAQQLAMFMADASALESTNTGAAEILWQEMPEFAG